MPQAAVVTVAERQRVVVALSGGVDSSVAAGLLQEQGHEVIGVTLHLWDADGAQQVGRCCAPEDRDDARATCDVLGIPHYVMDERLAFAAHVVHPFIRDNLAGITPAPCVVCNQRVKLGRLWEIARSLGGDALATGHYVRTARGDDGSPALLRGRDGDKDQSYFLYGIDPALIPHLRFPLGELQKADAREQGRRMGLPNFAKPDSQELCFVPDGDVRGFIKRHAEAAPGADVGREGAIVDAEGVELGRHAGIEGFTVGQRRGLGVSAESPRYVLRVVPETAEVVVGDAGALLQDGLRAGDAAWLVPPPTAPFEGSVRIRHRHAPAPARITPTPGGFSVAFHRPQRAVAPGQAAVVYAGERVLGGGLIR